MGDANNQPVGYGRPPKKNQFKPGQSGNPKGRPKGARNIANLVDQELDRKVAVTEDGKRRYLSKRQLAARQQVNKAAQGDPKAFQAITKLEQMNGPAQNVDPGVANLPQSELSDEQSLEIVLQWLEFLKQTTEDQPNRGPGKQP